MHITSTLPHIDNYHKCTSYPSTLPHIDNLHNCTLYPSTLPDIDSLHSTKDALENENTTHVVRISYSLILTIDATFRR